ncbi:MAG TPA: hypothetical protein VFC00_20750 [Micromonosporaceae bacterium]|nr:hypothetical protein [Micromonosporaceae bacterium]
MFGGTQRRFRGQRILGVGILLAALLTPVGSAQAAPISPHNGPTFTNAAAFDTSAPLRDLARAAAARSQASAAVDDVRPDRGPVTTNRGHAGDAAAQSAVAPATIPGTLANFDGVSNQDNFNVFGFRVNPGDPNGEVGPNHYVEMVNLVFAVFSKTGTRLLGPVDTGTLWADFPIDECTEPSGDPIVVYDQFADRWILTQFTTRGLDFPDEPLNLFYNCVAISTSGDPTGSYFRYAFSTGFNFPDYPKYGVWRDSYLITTREFGVLDPNFYGIGVYGLERNKMIEGDPAARAVSFVLDSSVVPINLMGDGLLPPDVDGFTKPKNDDPAPIVGSQDNGGPYGAAFDALNVWEFDVKWRSTPVASLTLKAQLPVAEFDSIFPCAPTSRDCLPQPGITDPNQFLDILSYRQRVTWRLAYRNFGSYQTMVTNQSVEATPGMAGERWYEIRRTNGTYTVHQQGTYAPNDGVHRWMGSIAMDKKGNAALGYSVVNGTNVFPGIRYTGRLAGDPLGQMPLGEGTIINGTGVQTTANSRWGDYSSMTVDPTDDCTFWYVNEYYTAAGQASSPAGWQTRISSFRLPGC